MEKKYYFRGLGLGIIVTAVIMGIALSGGKEREMTDEEVIARAKKLGMIEDSRLLEPSGETKDGAGKDAAAEPVKKDIAVAEQKERNKEEQAEASGEDKPVVGTPEQTAKEENGSAGQKEESPPAKEPAKDTNEMTKQDEDKPSGETAGSITIVGGDGSYTVAKKLQEAGIVNSADSFDTFLWGRGYDKKLRTGTFQIPANASDEQIARIVTGQ